jgi:hypothetical protein
MLASLAFNATGILLPEIFLTVSPTFVTKYTQFYGAPNVIIVPACDVLPSTGFNVTYSITNLPLPSFLTVNSDMSVTLPFLYNGTETFAIDFECQVPDPHEPGILVTSQF